MKKLSLLPVLIFSLFIISCDSATNDPATKNPATNSALTDNQKASYALAAVIEAVQTVPSEDLNGVKTASKSTTPPETTIYTSDTMVVTAKIVTLDTSISGIGLGLDLTVTLTNYALQTADSSEMTVSGKMDVIVAFRTNLLKQEMVIIANTPDMDKQLVFTGGVMDGEKLGLKDLEMAFDISSITGGISLGDPVSVKGTVYIDDVAVIINSEIISLLMGLFGA